MYQSHEFYLRRAIEISKEAREAGNTPFGALLVNKEERSSWSREILRLQRKSVQGTRKRHLQQEHLMNIPESFCWDCTLYTTAEPCDVSGAIYWANIGRVVYGMTERRLLELTGSNEQEPDF